ncbi:MAG TPA: response regulator transcription factor [Candidatus Polarisedimenticolia bacterium]|nr:response regulator transcription factor [Candidatus Polarisedimenticolia bacterium]
MKRISVLLAEDHTIVRAGLRALLLSEADMQVIGEARNGREAVQLAKRLQPAVVVMDIAMPLLNGLEATRQILRDVPETKILILSAHSEDEYVEQLTLLGAAGYLLKQASADFLARAIREISKGNAFFSPVITKRLQDLERGALDRGGRLRKRGAQLTSREVEVLQLIAEGKANKQTAAELSISIKTVEKHRQQIMNKLDLHDTASLTRYAIAAGIIESFVTLAIK